MMRSRSNDSTRTQSNLFFFFDLVTGPRRCLSLKLRTQSNVQCGAGASYKDISNVGICTYDEVAAGLN